MGTAPPCQPCPVTMWLPHTTPDSERHPRPNRFASHASGSAGAASAHHASRHAAGGRQQWHHTSNASQPGAPICGPELGRWITPFRRRIGRWLTDVSPLRPLLTSRRCSFTMQAAPWAGDWKPSLNLRFSRTQRGPSPNRERRRRGRSGQQPGAVHAASTAASWAQRYLQKHLRLTGRDGVGDFTGDALRPSTLCRCSRAARLMRATTRSTKRSASRRHLAVSGPSSRPS